MSRARRTVLVYSVFIALLAAAILSDPAVLAGPGSSFPFTALLLGLVAVLVTVASFLVLKAKRTI